MFKKTTHCFLLILTTSTAYAEENPEYIGDILNMPRVVVGDTLIKDVKLQLNFDNGKFAVTELGESIPRFSTNIVGIDEMLIDNIHNLSWINGSHACMINADAAMTASTDAVAYCSTLEFAGYSDWRAANSIEMSDMIINADRLDIQLNYRNPNCQFMATSDGFVKTENTLAPGEIVESAVNSGTRCVRNN